MHYMMLSHGSGAASRGRARRTPDNARMKRGGKRHGSPGSTGQSSVTQSTMTTRTASKESVPERTARFGRSSGRSYDEQKATDRTVGLPDEDEDEFDDIHSLLGTQILLTSSDTSTARSQLIGDILDSNSFDLDDKTLDYSLFQKQQAEIEMLRRQVQLLRSYLPTLQEEDQNNSAPAVCTTTTTTTTGGTRRVYNMRHRPRGQMEGTYTGEVDADSVPHGEGSILFENGDSYQGPFDKGQMHGRHGVYVWGRARNVYSGHFRNNLRHGHGETRFVQEGMRKYVGYYENDQPNGYGEEYGQYGNVVFRGQWQDGKPDGAGQPLSDDAITEDSRSWAIAAGDTDGYSLGSGGIGCDDDDDTTSTDEGRQSVIDTQPGYGLSVRGQQGVSLLSMG